MGNTDSHPHDDEDPFDGIDTVGYRVLGVQPNSPASEAGLVSFLDFLVGAEQKMLLGSGEGLEPGDEYDDVDLPALLNEYKGKEMELLVWNIKSQQARLVKLTPSDNWGGAGLLGVTIRLDNYAGAEDRLVRVLTVEPQSPAAVAGLVPEKDFLLGTTHQTLDSTAQLAAVLRDHQDQVVELYVYNTDSDMVRVVALMPTLAWGGGGLLGAEVGTGYLHRLPSKSRNTEGSSVERKVRYVGMPPTSKASKQGKQQQQQQPQQQQTLMEPEPQLEMEPSEQDDDSSSENVEELYHQKSAKLLNEHAAAPVAAADTANEAVEKEPIAVTSEVPEKEEPVAEPETPEGPPVQKQEVVRQQQDEPVSETAEATPPLEEEAKQEDTPPQTESSSSAATTTSSSEPENPTNEEASGGGVPQEETVAEPAVAASFMPPPPKMHYDSQPKQSQASS